MTDQGGAGGTREPSGASGMTGHGGDKGGRSQDNGPGENTGLKN